MILDKAVVGLDSNANRLIITQGEAIFFADFSKETPAQLLSYVMHDVSAQNIPCYDMQGGKIYIFEREGNCAKVFHLDDFPLYRDDLQSGQRINHTECYILGANGCMVDVDCINVQSSTFFLFVFACNLTQAYAKKCSLVAHKMLLVEKTESGRNLTLSNGDSSYWEITGQILGIKKTKSFFLVLVCCPDDESLEICNGNDQKTCKHIDCNFKNQPFSEVCVLRFDPRTNEMIKIHWVATQQETHWKRSAYFQDFDQVFFTYDACMLYEECRKIFKDSWSANETLVFFSYDEYLTFFFLRHKKSPLKTLQRCASIKSFLSVLPIHNRVFEEPSKVECKIFGSKGGFFIIYNNDHRVLYFPMVPGMKFRVYKDYETAHIMRKPLSHFQPTLKFYGDPNN